MSGKSRRVLRAKEAIGVKSSKNQSTDLIALTEQFNELKTNLKKLVAALRTQHASMQGLAKSRAQVAKLISALAADSPLSDAAGIFDENQSGGDGVSYASIHASVFSRQSMYSDRFLKFVVNYVVEWEKVVVTRVSESLKKAELLRRDLDHYQIKVEALRRNVNVKMAKGKLVDPKESEKLKRNEDKLMKSRKEYDEFTSDLCALIEEVTERSWKDCHPLFTKLSQFDATLSADEAKIFSGLTEITDSLKQVAKKHGLKPEARLKDIESQSAKMVSTKDRERALEYERTGALTAGDSFDGSGGGDGGGGSLLSPTAGGPLSPSPWDAPQNPPARVSSFSSFETSKSMTTSDMLSLAAAAAPPPTLDQLNDATGGLAVSDPYGGGGYGRHGLSSASLPPLPPSSARGYSRSSSLPPEYDAVGGLGVGRSASEGGVGPKAPAPSAPPPPPPPPQATLSMYSSSVDATSSSLVPSSTPSAGYGNYQTRAPAPVNTGLSSMGTQQQQQHPWSTTSTGSAYLSSPYQGGGNPNPFGGGGLDGTDLFGAGGGGGGGGGGGIAPMGQYGAPSPPPSFGAPMGMSSGSAHSASTNPFDG